MSKNKDKQINPENKKHVLLTVMVAFFSVLILIFWTINLSVSLNKSKSESNPDISGWQDDLNNTISVIKKEVAGIEPKSSKEKNFLNGMIDNLEQKSETDIIVSTSTEVMVDGVASSTSGQSNNNISPEALLKNLTGGLPTAKDATNTCPQFIDCMPSVDRNKPCVVPPGCENITQIAY